MTTTDAVTIDLRRHERAVETYSQRYLRMAKLYGPEDIIAEVMKRYPDDVAQLLTDAISIAFDARKLNALAASALDKSVRERIEGELHAEFD